MPIVLHIVLVCLLTLGVLGFAQEPQTPALTFQSWKEQQILEAQNQMLRISSRINQIKSAKPGKGDAHEAALSGLPSSRVRKAPDTDPLATAEKDLKRGQESLDAANSLQLDDYISIYLPTLQDQPGALDKLAEKLSKEELAEIFKGMLKRNSRPIDAKRNNISALESHRSF